MVFFFLRLAQDFTNVGAEYKMQIIEEVPGESAADLFFKAQKWSVTAYKSAKDVTQMSDPDNKTIILKGTFRINSGLTPRVVRHTVTIECKDGKYRATIDNFRQHFESDPNFEFGLTTNGGKKIIKRIESQARLIIQDLKKAMAIPKDEGW